MTGGGVAPDDPRGQVVLLNGAPRSRRPSIAAAAAESRPRPLQQETPVPALCDLEADASVLSPEAYAAGVRRGEGGVRRSAFQRLATMGWA